MKFFEKIKIPLIILVVCFVGFFVYKNFFAEPTPEDLTQQSAADLQQVATASSNSFRQTLEKLNTISFDTKVFDTPQFQELEDNTVRALEIRDQALLANPAGKPNPFSSVSGVTSIDLNGAGSSRPPQGTR